MKPGLLTKIELIIGLILLCIIVILVFMASIMRFFGHPLIWSVDFAQLLFIWLCFLGANRALRSKGHLGVDLFVRKLSARVRLYIEAVVSVFIVVFLFSLAYKGVQLTLLNRERLFGDSGIPYAFVTIAVPIGCVFMAITLISNFINAWRTNREEQTLILMKNEVNLEENK